VARRRRLGDRSAGSAARASDVVELAICSATARRRRRRRVCVCVSTGACRALSATRVIVRSVCVVSSTTPHCQTSPASTPSCRVASSGVNRVGNGRRQSERVRSNVRFTLPTRRDVTEYYRVGSAAWREVRIMVHLHRLGKLRYGSLGRKNGRSSPTSSPHCKPLNKLPASC